MCLFICLLFTYSLIEHRFWNNICVQFPVNCLLLLLRRRRFHWNRSFGIQITRQTDVKTMRANGWVNVWLIADAWLLRMESGRKRCFRFHECAFDERLINAKLPRDLSVCSGARATRKMREKSRLRMKIVKVMPIVSSAATSHRHHHHQQKFKKSKNQNNLCRNSHEMKNETKKKCFEPIV